MKSSKSTLLTLITATAFVASAAVAEEIVHDAEYYILKAQNGERWATEDKGLDAKLDQLREKFGQPPNIVYILWDDTAYGAVGYPGLQKNFGYETPNINQMAAEGINFTPACTPSLHARRHAPRF